MTPYMVKVTTFAVVVARDERHALEVASASKREIFRDDDEPEIAVLWPITKTHNLPGKWDGECIPYGGDGDTNLEDLVGSNVKVTGPAAVSSPQKEMRSDYDTSTAGR